MSKIVHIVCAVRGMPEYTPTVTRAIELALEHEARLTFLLVLQVEFLGRATPTLRTSQPVYRQLRDMAEFSMMLLLDRARRKGVENVDSELRQGKLRRQLRKFAQETQADLIVMGRPLQDSERSEFTQDEFDAFTKELEQIGNLEVIKVETGPQARPE